MGSWEYEKNEKDEKKSYTFKKVRPGPINCQNIMIYFYAPSKPLS